MSISIIMSAFIYSFWQAGFILHVYLKNDLLPLLTEVL